MTDKISENLSLENFPTIQLAYATGNCLKCTHFLPVYTMLKVLVAPKIRFKRQIILGGG